MKQKRSGQKNKALLWWLFSHIKPQLAPLAVQTLLQSAGAVAGVLTSLALKSAVDAAQEHDAQGIVGGFVLLCVLIAGQYLARYISARLQNSIGIKVGIRIKSQIMESLCRKRYSEVLRYHSGELMNRLTTDVETASGTAINFIPRMVTMAARLVCAAVVLSVLSPQLVLISAVFGLLVAGAMLLFRRKLKALQREVRESEGRVRSFMQETLSKLAVVKAFRAAGSFMGQLGLRQEDNAASRVRHNRFTVFAGTAMGLCFSVAYLIALGWGVYSIYIGTFTYGTLTAVLQLVTQIRTPLAGIGQIVPQYYSMLVSTERLMELEKLTDEQSSTLDETDFGSFRRLCINHLDFAYETGDYILKDVSFELERGQLCALSGQSGIGKSTLIKLLLNLYEPRHGSIEYDCGAGLVPLDASARGLFAYVPQGNMLFSGTVRENLTLFCEGVPEERIHLALRAACAEEFTAQMPQGLDSVLTEGGGGISEGQAQRLAIARAILSDAPILLLDEASSALDEETELELLENIRKLKRTCLFISHRPAVNRIATLRLTAEDGRIHCDKA